MNPGTFYLYEYENYDRRRNVGFIKVSRHYRSCILQIHAGGIPVRNGSILNLSAFCREQDKLLVSQIAVLTSCGRNISIRLSVSETHFPQGRPLRQIDGFLLQNPDRDAPPLFWMASSFFFDIGPDMMLPAGPGSASGADPSGPEGMPASESMPEPESAPVSASTPEPESAPVSVSAPEPETASETETVVETKTTSENTDGVKAESGLQSAEAKDLPRVKKISSEDLSLLPRKFWSLASNSFLLHGYNNYHHLALIEEGGRRWLGVPGIYDTREARAADLFGFPRFTRAYVSVLNLTDEERNAAADFGHWCRCVGTGNPSGCPPASPCPDDRLR